MKKKFKDDDLPIYEVLIDEDDSSTGFQLISIVRDPAIGIKAMSFAEMKDVKIELKAYEDSQSLAGPALIPNIKIYRNDDYGEYFIVFKPDQIKKMVERFNKNGTNRKINFNHEDKMVDAYIEQQWIIKDKMYDGSRAYGFTDLPVGTFFIICKVEDEKFWKTFVKGEGFDGFSVQGYFGMELIQLERQFQKELDEILLSISELQKVL